MIADDVTGTRRATDAAIYRVHALALALHDTKLLLDAVVNVLRQVSRESCPGCGAERGKHARDCAVAAVLRRIA